VWLGEVDLMEHTSRHLVPLPEIPTLRAFSSNIAPKDIGDYMERNELDLLILISRALSPPRFLDGKYLDLDTYPCGVAIQT